MAFAGKILAAGIFLAVPPLEQEVRIAYDSVLTRLVALPLMKYCLRSCLHNDSFCEEYLLVAVQPNAFRSVAVAQ